MSERRKRHGWLRNGVVALAAILVIFVKAHVVTKAQYSGLPVSSPVALGDPATVVQYWTPMRMATAKIISPTVSVASPTGLPTDTMAAGQPGLVNGYNPAKPGNVPGPVFGFGDGVDALTEPYHGSISFTRWQYAARYRNYPQSTVAKIFFSNNGGNYVCSGSTISLNGVWTAGHCAVNTEGGGQWSTNVLVCPSYDSSQGGVNPAVGCWSAVGVWGWCPQWCSNGAFEYDFGGFTMSNCGTVNCTNIGNVTGFLGFAWNQSRDQNWIAQGYPQAAPFTGGKMISATSSEAWEDNASGLTPNSTAMGNDMTGGSSGGPWIWQYGSGNYLNGHNDWRHTAVPNEMNTPYFDSRACQMYNSITGASLSC